MGHMVQYNISHDIQLTFSLHCYSQTPAIKIIKNNKIYLFKKYDNVGLKRDDHITFSFELKIYSILESHFYFHAYQR